MPDLANWYKGVIRIAGPRTEFAESYVLDASTLATAKNYLKYLAHWRAATLARGFRVREGILARIGSDKDSSVVIKSPILGSTGVKFDVGGFTTKNVQCDVVWGGLSYRLETSTLHHITRNFGGIPDALVQNMQYIGVDGTANDTGPEPQTAVGTTDPTVLPDPNLFDFAATPDPNLANLVAWDVAFGHFLAGLRDFTLWYRFRKDTTIVSSESTDPTTTTDGTDRIAGVGEFKYKKYSDVVYKRVGKKSPGRPSKL